jgi:hypothetical protein
VTTKEKIFVALADCGLREASSILYQAQKENRAAGKAYRMIRNAIDGKIDTMSACLRIKEMLWSEDLPEVTTRRRVAA